MPNLFRFPPHHSVLTTPIMAALFVSLVGCNNSKFEFAKVEGRVLLDGSPVPEAKVVFMPTSQTSDGEAGPYSMGVTDAEGVFTLNSVEKKPHAGAVVGPHKIIVSTKRSHLAPDSLDVEIIDSPETIPPQYSHYKKTTLQFEVPSGGTDEANLDLVSTGQ